MSEEGTVVETTEDETLPPAETEVDPFEDRARRMGWRPEAEFRGPPGKWVDAKTFVERGETELPILRERFRAQDTRLMNTEKQLEESNRRQAEMTQVLTEMREMSRVSEERGYSRAMAELAARERKAVTDAAVEEYDRIQHEKRQLTESHSKITSTPPVEPKPPVEPPKPQGNPIIEAWMADNPWFNTDPLLTPYAIAEDAQLQKDAPYMGMSDRLVEVRKRTVERFPEKFGNPRRKAPSTVTTTSLAPPKSTKRTIKDLPKEAQEAFAKFKKQMPSYTEDEYLAIYGD